MNDLLTNRIKRYFIKDFKIPISSFIEEHFEYYLELTNPYYNSLEYFKFLETYLSDISKRTNDIENTFVSENSNIGKSIIQEISKTKAYLKFNQMDMTIFNVSNLNIIKGNFYKRDNVGKTFISIDLKKANFQALKYVNPEIVLNCNSYEELVSKFSNFDYHKKSKQFRQVIFGNLNAKRQQKVQKYLMSLIVNELIKEGMQAENILSFTSDEIIFEKNKFSKNIFDFFYNRSFLKDIELHVNEFTLKSLTNEHNYFYKEDINDKSVEFKMIPSNYIFECIKKYENKDIVEADLLFYHEGRLCKHLNPLF